MSTRKKESRACVGTDVQRATLRVALVQHDAGRDAEANLQAVEALLPQPGAADLVLLPELFLARGGTRRLRASAQDSDGSAVRRLSSWARAGRSWLLAGGLVERRGERLFNTAYLFDRSGRRVACYRKMHLFEVCLEDGTRIRERDVFCAGDRPALVTIEGWRCGLSICYDLRFPELFRWYAARGMDLLLVPANFTSSTGRAHWEVLLRARAIENQCFVAAVNQCGINPDTGTPSYGNSLVADAWGKVLVRAGSDPCLIESSLDPAALDGVRRGLPALRHTRFRVQRVSCG